jgi:hypothetical protein
MESIKKCGFIKPSGKFCKRPAGDEGFCWQHDPLRKSSTPRKSSITSSVGKSSPLNMKRLKGAALKNLLLFTDPYELYNVCSINKEARKICQSSSFIEEYNRRSRNAYIDPRSKKMYYDPLPFYIEELGERMYVLTGSNRPGYIVVDQETAQRYGTPAQRELGDFFFA